MTEAVTLLRREPQARVFFAAVAQSSLGTGAAYIGLLLVAYQRFHSPWAISLILLAEFVPAMLLGPVLGAAADRWSRRRCAVAADVVRAGAFIGIGLVGSFEATVALALVAGFGTALFRPAVLAALPSLVAPERSAAATSLYGTITDAGFTLGPALAAAWLLVFGAEELVVANGATFAVSALLVARLRFGDAPPRASDATSSGVGRALLADTREGLRAVVGMPAVAIVLGVTGAGMLSGGVFNVAELPFATDVLGSSGSGYSALVALYGLGFAAGSLQGSRGGGAPILKRRYLHGLALTGAGGVAIGLSPGLLTAGAGFALAGFGNGLFVVHQRLLLQSQVPQPLQGRVFGLADTLTSWGFAVAFVSAGALIELAGVRSLILATGAWELTLAIAAFLLLRRQWRRETSTGGRYDPAAQRAS
jgi:MFS family permease